MTRNLRELEKPKVRKQKRRMTARGLKKLKLVLFFISVMIVDGQNM